MQLTRQVKDKLSSAFMLTLLSFSLAIVFFIGWELYARSLPLLRTKSLFSLMTSGVWRPFKGEFGFYPYILGSLWVVGLSILIALPTGLLASIYLSEYADYRVRKLVNPFIDLLSGIPPVVFGLWGVIFIVPFIRDHMAPHFTQYSSGYSVLAGGIVLSIMLLPLLMGILAEIFHAIPRPLREASLSLGATQWQTIKHTVLRKSLPGIIAATILAVSRALGETIAVLMVCGNVALAPHSIFDPGYPLPALIANNYGEMLSVPLYDSALLLAAFILFVIIFLFNALSRLVLLQLERRLA